MMKRLGLVSAVLLVSLATASATFASDDSAKAETLARRLGNSIKATTEPHRSSSVDWGEATAVIDAPFDSVAEVVRDYGEYKQFLPHFRKSRVLSERGPNALVYLQASVIKDTVTLWAQMRILERPGRGATRLIEADMMKGNMNKFSGRWELTPIDGGSRTLVKFRLLVDPDLPLPSSVFSKENRKSARKTLEALREQVQKRRRLAQNG